MGRREGAGQAGLTMNGSRLLAALALTGMAGSAAAGDGSFFKNLFNGNGVDGVPSVTAPRAYDPDDAYCPTVTIKDNAASIQVPPGSASTGIRHQITFGRISRECAVREGGALGVKVGLELRALIGPLGAPGTFDAPVTIAIRYNEKIITSRTRRVAVRIAPGETFGSATVIESDLNVPAEYANGYDIDVGLEGAHAKASPKVAAKRRKPATDEAAATAASEAPVAGQ